MASALLAARRKSHGTISAAPRPQLEDEAYELILLPREGRFYSGHFDMVTSRAGIPKFHDTLPHLDRCRQPISLTVNPPSDAAPEGTLVLADTGDKNVFVGELDKETPHYAALVPLSPKADGTKRMGMRLLDAAVNFHKQVQSTASALAAPALDELEPVAGSTTRKNRFATRRAEVLRKQGQHMHSEADTRREKPMREDPAGPARGTTADQRREQKIKFAYEKQYEANQAAETHDTGRYRRLMPDEDDDDDYRAAFVAEGAAPRAKPQRYGGIGGSSTHAADSMLAATGQEFGSLRDEGVANLEDFHEPLEDEEVLEYDANEATETARIEEEHQGFIEQAAAEDDEDDEDDEEEDGSGKPLTEKQLAERRRANLERHIEEDDARKAAYQRTVRGEAAAAARAAAAAAAAARSSKKRPREDTEATGGGSAAAAGPQAKSSGPPLPRSAGPPAAKSSRLSGATSSGPSTGGRRNPFDGSVNPRVAIAEEIRRELISHGMSCKYRIMVNFLQARIRACGQEYKKIALAALKRMTLQQKNAQGETVYKLKKEFWKQ